MIASLFDEPVEQSRVTLRPYQVDCLEAIRNGRKKGVQRGLIVLATGLGKTTVFSHLIGEEVCAGGRALVLAHRAELLEQAAERIHQQCQISVGVEAANMRADSGCKAVVASVQTLARSATRLSSFEPTLVVCDEAHHAAADSYMSVARRMGCFEPGGAFHLGVTATPHRLDNRPLHGHERAIFDEVLFDYGIVPGIREGWLSDIRAYRARAGYSLDGVKTTAGDYNQQQLEERANTEEENLAAFKHWKEVASDRRTIVFCAGVSHAQDVAQIFRDYRVSAASVDGTMHKDERADILRRFKRGDIQVLTNCNIATEGFDAPETGCVLLLRPTQSWSLFVQMVGRGLRTAHGKSDCIVLDIVGTGDDMRLASVPEMLGLPPGLASDGVSATKALERMESVRQDLLPSLWQRQFALSDIDTVLREVDLLAELDVPDRVKSLSRLAWSQVGESRFVLKCGQERVYDEASGTWTAKGDHRLASLTFDTLGRATLTLSEGDTLLDALTLDDDERQAFRQADEAVLSTWPSARALVDQQAGWRTRRDKSDKQLHWLRRAGYTDAQIAEMTMAQASAALDKFFSSRKKR